MLADPPVVEVLTRVIGPNVKAMQSMLFIKAEGKPGQAWHQDEFFIPTRDRSLTAVWMALDDATVDNGCLWVMPGPHTTRRSLPRPRAGGPAVRLHGELFGFPYTDADTIPIEVPAGAALVVQRLSAAPVVAELRPPRVPADVGQPLYERGIDAPVEGPDRRLRR